MMCSTKNENRNDGFHDLQNMDHQSIAEAEAMFGAGVTAKQAGFLLRTRTFRPFSK